MCQEFIFAPSVSSPHSTQMSRMQTLTDNTEAHEPKLTFNRNLVTQAPLPELLPDSTENY